MGFNRVFSPQKNYLKKPIKNQKTHGFSLMFFSLSKKLSIFDLIPLLFGTSIKAKPNMGMVRPVRTTRTSI